MKDKLKEINSKHYMECDVVMLATDKTTTIFFTKDKLEYFKSFTEHGQINLTKMHMSNKIKPQHLYFLSSEEIKEPCWCINENRDTVYFIQDNLKSANENWNKIIATTDTSLTTDINGIGTVGGFHYKYLPQPSKEFIQAYIKAFNEDKPITKVLVEMEKIHVGWEPDYTFENEGIEGSKKMYQYFLKVNSSNEITIKKVKDSYTREEVKELLHKCWIASTAKTLEPLTQPRFKIFIDEHL